jgi:Skp family chaperone for outer membrane proteins
MGIWGMFLGTFLLVSSPLNGAAQPKIGYVISQKILVDSDAGRDFMVEKDELEEKKKQQLLNEAEKLKQLIEEAKSKQMFLKSEAKEELGEEIKEKEKRIERLKEDSVSDIKRFVKNAMRKMNEEASKIIMKIGDREKYDLIIDINSRINNVVYINPESDITDQVIEQYNQQYNKEKQNNKPASK